MKKLIACTLLVFCAFIAFGYNQADSIKVYFSVGESQYEPALRGNAKVMDAFINELKDARKTGEIDSVVIRAFASPDGYNNSNVRLTVNRCQTLADYLVLNAGINPTQITKIPEGVAWGELRRLVETTHGVPKREQVLNILDNTPIWIYNSAGKVVGGRKKALMDLAGGVPYNWMLKNLFPELRNAVAVSLFYKTQVETQPVIDTETQEDTRTIVAVNVDIEEDSTANTEIGFAPVTMCSPKRFALKTNILYDAALMPNLEFEWLINTNWSVAVEGGVAWWSNEKRHKYYQLAYVSPEVRYHILPRKDWHGMYAGVFVGGGKYDLENGGNGYKGEGGMAGLSFGYMWPISKRWSLEAAIGAGYMFTRYQEYEPREGHYLYQRTKDLHYFGPLKLKFAIAWRFGAKCKPTLNQSAL